MKNRHRVFIAINLSNDIKKSLVKSQKKIQEMFSFDDEEINSKAIKWTKEDNLHITLDFLGYITDQEVVDICEIVKDVASNHEEFMIDLTKISYGPKLQADPKMIWITGENSEELVSLKNDLSKELGVPEVKTYNPHITLARINRWFWHTLDPEEVPNIDEEINISFSVNSIDVVESILKKSGPQYTVLESAPLS